MFLVFLPSNGGLSHDSDISEPPYVAIYRYMSTLCSIKGLQAHTHKLTHTHTRTHAHTLFL
jgi:hypothetical protein